MEERNTEGCAHFCKCALCNEWIDRRDLEQVVDHLHTEDREQQPVSDTSFYSGLSPEIQ